MGLRARPSLTLKPVMSHSGARSRRTSRSIGQKTSVAGRITVSGAVIRLLRRGRASSVSTVVGTFVSGAHQPSAAASARTCPDAGPVGGLVEWSSEDGLTVVAGGGDGA